MRQRKIKDIENKLLNYSDLLVESPMDYRGKWRSIFDGEEGRKFLVEIGCGKGKFIAQLSQENPEDRFIAIEGFSSVIYRAAEKVRKGGQDNVRFILDFVFDLGTWFDDGEIDGIYLNFSDPWPKKKNAKRRLTYRDRLEQYNKALAPGGFLRIKTDNDDFFQFTLEEIEEYNERRKRTDDKAYFEILKLTRDLHNSEWKDDSPMTEYESKFVETGKNINYVELKKIP